MLRTTSLTARSPYSADSIRCAFANEAYWRARLGAFDGGSPTLDSLATDVSGTTSVVMTMRFGGDQLPDPIRRLRLASLEIVQREQWCAIDGDGVRGEIAIHAPRTPISGRGSVHLVPVGSGTQFAGTATVKVNLPLIGGAIATFVVAQLAIGIVDVVRVTDSWLADHGRNA